MKRGLLLFLLLSLFGSAALFTGCGDDDEDPVTGDSTVASTLNAGELKFNDGSQDLLFTNVTVATPSEQTIITAVNGNMRLDISLRANGTGTYDLNLTTSSQSGTFGLVTYSEDTSVSASNFYTGISGTCEVTQDTGSTISGTFSFVGTRSGNTNLTASNGEFYQLSY